MRRTDARTGARQRTSCDARIASHFEEADELGQGEGSVETSTGVDDGRRDVVMLEAKHEIEPLEVCLHNALGPVRREIEAERAGELDRLGKRGGGAELEDAEGGNPQRKVGTFGGERCCRKRASEPVTGADERHVESVFAHWQLSAKLRTSRPFPARSESGSRARDR